MAAISEVADGLPPRRRSWAVAALSLGLLLAVLQTNVVNIALPMISADLGTTAADAVWIATASQLAILATLFPLAALGERFGYRRVYCWGLAASLCGSLACALSSSLDQLVAARAFQGIGISAVMAVNLALFRFVFPRRQIGLAVGFSTFIVAVSSTLGPTVAGAILSAAEWPWLFVLDMPVGIVALVIALLALPATPASSRTIDVVGGALTAATFIALILMIDAVGNGAPFLTSGILGSTFFLVGFVLIAHQIRQTHAMLPLDLMAIPQLRLSVGAAMLCYIVQGLCFVALPFYLHDVADLSPALVGLAMSPWPLGVAVAAPIGGWLTARCSPGLLGTAGLSILLCGLLSLIHMSAQPDIEDIAWRTLLCGIGFGMFQSPNSVAIMINAPVSRSGGASAVQSASRLIGQTVGVALSGAILGRYHLDAAAPALAIAAVVTAVAGALSAWRLLIR